MALRHGNHNRIILTTAASCLLALVAVGYGQIPAPNRLRLGGAITGTLLGDLPDPRTKRVRTLPAGGVQVTLSGAQAQAIDQTRTDRFGRFRFSRLAPGSYKVCWADRRWGQGCREGIKLEHLPISLRLIRVDPRQLVPERFPEFFQGFVIANRCKVNDADRFLVKRRNSADGNPASEGQIATNYYKAIDPFDKRATLGQWWEANGFHPITGAAPAEANGFEAAHVSYLNDNDLGFGRDMHCLKRNGNVACWVANHGAADQNPANADLAAAGKDPGATVTMEYRALDQLRPFSKRFGAVLRAANPALDPTGLLDLRKLFAKQVTFYVYKPDGDVPAQAPADYRRATSANLDGCGEKFVPGLCLNCHGGEVPGSISDSQGHNLGWSTDELLEVGLGASFREFDHPTYKFPGGRTTVNVVEEAMFYTLNQLVLSTNPESGIQELIAGWYAAGTTLNRTFVPSGWQAAPAPYSAVVGRYCRTCHVAFEDFQNWNSAAEMQDYDLNDYLCAEQSMPHASVTYFNMDEAARVELLTHFGQSVCE